MDSPTILLLADSVAQRPQQVDAGPIGVHAQMERARRPELRRQLLQCRPQHCQLPSICRRPPDLHDTHWARGWLSTFNHCWHHYTRDVDLTACAGKIMLWYAHITW